MTDRHDEAPKMLLSHWSAKPVEIERRRYTQESTFKPNGLWFDVDRDWHRFCVKEDWNLENLTYRHTIEIDARADLVKLSSARDIDEFTREYLIQQKHYYQEMEHRLDKFRLSEAEWENKIYDYSWDLIDWERVAAEHDGIIITPYCWPRRLNLIWYYGWDCASGCVWNSDLVKITEIEKVQGD